MLEPVRDVGSAAAQEFAAEHRQSAVDVSFARDWEALVGESCHGQIRPLPIIAWQLWPAPNGDSVEVLRLNEALEREVETRRPLVVDAVREGSRNSKLAVRVDLCGNQPVSRVRGGHDSDAPRQFDLCTGVNASLVYAVCRLYKIREPDVFQNTALEGLV